MPPTKEWLHRIQQWEKVLWQSCYFPLAEIPLAGFTTHDRLNPDQTLKNPFHFMPPGTRWGRNGNMAGLPPISLSPRKLPANGLFLMPIQRIIPPILANVWYGLIMKSLGRLDGRAAI
jgi:hypothetical protein